MQPENNVHSNMSVPTTPPVENMMAQGIPRDGAAGEKKKGKGMFYGMILLAILAAGGIGFGVWAMLSGNQQAESLNSQIADLKQTNSELLDQMVMDTDEGDTIINVDNSANTVDTANYIYVGEWGLKIKIPESLKSISYNYGRNSNGPAVVIVGSEYDGKYIPENLATMGDNMGITGLGSVQRYTKGVEIAPTSPPSLVFSDNEYDYYYHSPQKTYQVQNEDENKRQNDIIDLVKEMLTNSDNYSKI